MNHKILIVECEPPGASGTVRALRTAGFRVVAPASATTALATFDRVRPDLVLVGRSLPDDGGVALCREIKKTPHGGRTPVALLLDNVEIDLPPMAELGWDRLIENGIGNDELVATCRQLIEARGKPLAAEMTTESRQSAQPGGESRSLEDVIDEVLTFEHEQSVAHVQRAPAATAPATPKPAAAPERAVAVAPRAPQAERPRFQTAALVTPKPETSEVPGDEPTPRQSPPARRWWAAAVVVLGAAAIAVAAWVGLSGENSPAPEAMAPTAIAPPAARVPNPLPITAPVATAAAPENSTQAGTGTIAAGVAPFETEPAPETAKPEPVVAKTQPKPAPQKPKPEPVVAKTQPKPAPEPPKPEPVVVETQPEPTPEPPEPEPEVTEPEKAEPAPEPPKPEPVAPVLLQRVEPTPSPKALKKNQGATIVLRLLVNEQGSVIRVVVDQGLPGSELEAAAVNAVLRWRYRPATRGGAPVQAWTEARFTF